MNTAINIDIFPGMAQIDPIPDHGLLQHLLEYDSASFKPGGPKGYREQESVVRFWDLDRRNRLLVPPGLVAQVQERLTEAGHTVAITDHRQFGERLEIAGEVLDDVTDTEREVLDAVQEQPIGRIEVKGKNDTIEKMAAICRLYPQARVLVLVTTKQIAWDVRWKLQQQLDLPVYLTTKRGKRGRIVVHVFKPTGPWPIDEQRDLVLLPDAASALNKVGWKTLGGSDFTESRIYSFVQVKQKFSHREQVILSAISGPVIYSESHNQLGVQVVWLETLGCQKIPEGSPLELKRHAYWRNDRRNDFIAGVARAFVDRDEAKLRKYGAPSTYTPMVFDEPREALVNILVESTEHGRELLRRLPGWTMIDSAPERTERPNPDATGFITTLTAANQYGLKADVLVRASGGMGIGFKGFPGTKRSSDDPDSVVIDFTDRFDEQCAKNASNRSREYHRIGWYEQDHAETAVTCK